MNDIERKQQTWNIRVKKAREKNGITQYALAETINKKYNTSITQNTVSRWENCSGKKGLKSFPDYVNMLRIADSLDVDIGFLTGETDFHKYSIMDISKETGLSEKAIENIQKITNPSTAFSTLSAHFTESTETLNALLESNCFFELISALIELRRTYDLPHDNENLKKLSECIGTERLNRAIELDQSQLNDIPQLLSESEIEDYNEFIEARDADHQASEKYFYKIKVHKYELFRKCSLLIDSLFQEA